MPQQRHLAYSTYAGAEGGGFGAVNAGGELCVAVISDPTGTHLKKLHSDGTLAYDNALNLSSTGQPVGVAVDGAGNCFIAVSDATTFVVVRKYDAQGNFLLQGKITGSGSLFRPNFSVDSLGHVWVSGTTVANDAQTLNPIQGVLQGQQDAYVAEFDSTLTLIFATYFGGSTNSSGGGAFTNASALALDANGTAHITGNSDSVDFPALNHMSTTPGPFLVKIDSAGHLQYSSYLGTTLGAGSTACGVALDSTGNILMTGAGSTFSTSTLVKLDPTASNLLYSVQLGGQCIPSLAVDNQGNAYTAFKRMPAQPPLLNPIQSDVSEAKLVGLDPSGNLIFTSFFGSINSLPTSIGVDVNENIYIETNDSSEGRLSPLPIINAIDGMYPPVFCGHILCQGSWPVVAKIALGAGDSFSMPEVVDFLPAAAGSVDPNSPISINIYNTGTTTIGIQGISISGNYSQTNNCPATLTPATNCSLSIIFSPKAGGAQNGAITIVDDSPDSPHVIQLTGTGTVPIVSLDSQSLTFAPQATGTTSPVQAVTLTNSGVANLNINRIEVSGDFAETNDCGSTVGGKATCTISITFSPTSTGSRTGTLTITDNAAGSPQTVNLSGTGISPGPAVVSLSSQSLTFASQAAGTTSAAQMETLTNSGGTSLNISHIAVSGDFAETHTCGTSVGAGANCTISVTFAPTAAGSRVGTLTITDDASGSPQTVSLSGTGAAPNFGLGVASGSSSSASVPAGAAANYTLVIGGQGMGGTVSLTCTDAPKQATCSVPASVSVSATKPSSFIVTVTTTVRSSASLFPHYRVPSWMWAFSIFGMVLLPTTLRTQTLFKNRTRLLVFALLLPLCSCGGSSANTMPPQNGTPTGTYTLHVSASMGSNTQTTALTLTVQ